MGGARLGVHGGGPVGADGRGLRGQAAAALLALAVLVGAAGPAAAKAAPSAAAYLWEFEHGVGFSPQGCRLLPAAYVQPCLARTAARQRARYLYYWQHDADFSAAQCHLLPTSLWPACLMAVLVQLTYPPAHPETVAARVQEVRAFEAGAPFDLARCARLPAAFVAACVARVPHLDAALACQGVSGTVCPLAARGDPRPQGARPHGL
jgi:hypothetical protein